MANLLQLIKGNKSFGTRSLFSEASFSIEENEHVGVIGPNGAGKTTLFKILAGEDTIDSGELVQKRGLRIGYLKQHDDWAPGTTVEQYLEQATGLPIWELKSLGRGLGLSENHFSAPLDLLSGGYRTRAKLLFLIGCEPDILLLDEPTNYLDLESTLVLESFLQETKSAFLLISHDREFLRRTTDHILEVEAGDIVKFNGSLDDYFEQKEILRTQLEARALSQAQKKTQILEFVARFGAKASKARQAQSRLKQLGRMENIDLKPIPLTARIEIPKPSHCGKTVLSARNVELGYAEKVVLRDIQIDVQRGDHVAVVGVNGAGKSTFLKALSQKLHPLKGKIELGYEVHLGYYAQHVAESLNPSDTVIESLSRAAPSEVSQQQVLNMAGSLLFSGDDSKKKVSVLSGGEKSRVALGQILLKKAPLLVLDEPTNHLDFQTVEALTVALNEYEGSVIVVSHDRSFIKRVGRKILEIKNGEMNLYPGSYDEYVWSQQNGILKNEKPILNSSPSLKNQDSVTQPTLNQSKNSYQTKKQNEKEIAKLEKQIEKIENKIQLDNEALTVLLAENADTQRKNSDKITELLKSIAQDQKTKEELENAWLVLTG